MEYQEFLQAIKEAVSKRLSSEYEVSLNSVVKNNDQKLDAITIMGQRSNIAPNIYLNRYYEEFKAGRGLDTIINEILDIFNTKSGKIFETIPDILNFDSISEQITYRLINLDMNVERLNNLPHQVVEDMVKVYYIVVNSDPEEIASVAVTYDMVEKWGVGIERIDELANNNTPCLFPQKLKSMSEVIKEMMSIQYGGLFDEEDSTEDKDVFEQFFSELTDSPKGKDDVEMYVLSNVSNINGASALLYSGVLHNFAEEQNSNIYILPSSIHEVILVPDNGKISKESLREMVIDVNQSQVPIEEVLSNEVYYYDLKGREFHIAKDE